MTSFKMAQIRVKTGPNKGRVYPIGDAPITVGREESQVIQILDQGVSRAHAEILRIGELCFVRDHNSTNGTFVNEQRITEETLKTGDELLIGTTLLVFEDDLAPDVPSAVRFESPAELKTESTSVELKVDDQIDRVARLGGGRDATRNLTVVSHVGNILRREPSLQEAFERTVDTLCSILKANQGFLFLSDREAGRLTPRAVVEHEEAGSDDKVSRTIISRVQQNRVAMLTTDASSDQRFDSAESIILKKIKSVICAPILVEDRVDGVLYFHSNKVDHALTPHDLELVTSVALQLSLAVSNGAAHERLRKGLMGTIRALVTAMEIVNPRDQGHAQRVADFSAALGAQMGLSAEDLHRTRLAALLHDVGKLAVHHAGQGSAAGATDDPHVQAGERMLTGIEGFEQILPGVKYHHERADGSGYPYRVKNAEIPVMARIIIVANAFDNACTSGGEGGKGLPSRDVVKDMAQKSGAQFDEEAVKALLLAHRNGSLYGSMPPPPE